MCPGHKGSFGAQPRWMCPSSTVRHSSVGDQAALAGTHRAVCSLLQLHSLFSLKIETDLSVLVLFYWNLSVTLKKNK